MALSQVIGALADGRIDGTKAGRVIYALQVAAQFAPSSPRSPASDPVESITLTSDGDELAPEEIKCFQSDDCDTCPYRDECDGEESDEDDEDDDGEEDADDEKEKEDQDADVATGSK
jgi:hypothetical protein